MTYNVSIGGLNPAVFIHLSVINCILFLYNLQPYHLTTTAIVIQKTRRANVQPTNKTINAIKHTIKHQT